MNNYALFLILAVGLVVLLEVALSKGPSQLTRCEELGGYWLVEHYLCLKKDAIIEMPK